MMAYDPSEKKYPGDELFRKSTVTLKRKRAQSPAPVSLETARKEAPENRKLGNLSMLEEHWVSVIRAGNAAKCKICSEKTVFRCEKCGPKEAVCAPWSAQHKACFLRQHDTGFFGLSYGDVKAVGSCSKQWKMEQDINQGSAR